VFGVGLGFTAFLLGVRHAFDADHIAVIDNTTRKLVGEGKHGGTLPAETDQFLVWLDDDPDFFLVPLRQAAEPQHRR
jgi:hypothetical protein